MESAAISFATRQFEEHEILTNACIKRYPNCFRVACWSRPIYMPSGYEIAEQSKRNVSICEPLAGVRADSARRARSAIFDISALNDWDYFVTLTLDAGSVDRYDAKAVVKPFCKWLQNMVQRRGLRYLVVPELHKDGAIHFHGLFREGLKMVDSGTLRFEGRKKPIKAATAKRLGLDLAAGQKVYNIEDYKLGFSSAISVYGDRENLAKYMTKYITKDLSKIFGNFYFAGGHELKRKPLRTLLNLDFESISSPQYGGEYGLVKYVFIPSIDALNDFLEVAAQRPLTRQEAQNLFHG